VGRELVPVQQRRVEAAAVDDQRRDPSARLQQEMLSRTQRFQAGREQVRENGALLGDSDIHTVMLLPSDTRTGERLAAELLRGRQRRTAGAPDHVNVGPSRR
jgi:hypothetical protein